MRILYCGSGWLPVVDAVARKLPAADRVEIWDRRVPLAEAARDADVLLPSNGGAGAEVVTGARALRLIQQPAAGIDGIDLAAARARGVPVCNAPGANHVAVAEAALLLILALARRLPQARKDFAAQRIGVPAGMELRGKTLGVVGMGRSGTALAERARALGMRVVGTSRAGADPAWAPLLETADVISVHCPLTSATRGLFDRRVLAAMKPGALLVNCARGPILDRAAVIEALASGHLGGLGLDTPWTEPWDPADPLFARDDVIALPHVAGSTVESFERISDIVCENLDRLRRGAPLLHRVA